MTNDEIEEAFWSENGEARVVREESSPPWQPTYDREERTARFGEAVVDFANSVPQTPVTRRLIEQLVGCGTSVGANYCEADNTVSKKEARETKYFLRMIARTVPELKSQARPFWLEAKELHLIFAKIWRSAE